MLGGPGVAPRRLLPNGWGATSVLWAPGGRALAVSRSRYGFKRPGPRSEAVWLLDPAAGTRRLLYAVPYGAVEPPLLATFSPNGQSVIAWEDPQNSASLAADGLPLIAIPLQRRAGADPQRSLRPFANTLGYSDFLSWCPHDRLAYVINHGGRQVTLDDRIGLAKPPRWRTIAPASPARSAHLSFNSPTCAPRHRPLIAAAVGPASQDLPFGHEHRSIWLLRAGRWRALEPTPPGKASDELPMWSTDGQ